MVHDQLQGTSTPRAGAGCCQMQIGRELQQRRSEEAPGVLVGSDIAVGGGQQPAAGNRHNNSRHPHDKPTVLYATQACIQRLLQPWEMPTSKPGCSQPPRCPCMREHRPASLGRHPGRHAPEGCHTGRKARLRILPQLLRAAEVERVQVGGAVQAGPHGCIGDEGAGAVTALRLEEASRHTPARRPSQEDAPLPLWQP